ncbi:MAG: GAF domain-containing protein [Elusimicrobia bacterium]|nr:GAF domain-containing protein [Elusimicrobiota bacterium]
MGSVEQQSENFELLLEVGRLLSSKIDLQELLTTVMQLAARVVNAETASLFLVDPATDELYFHIALGLDPALAKLRFKKGVGIVGAVAQTASPMIINDVRKDPRWTSKVDKDSGFVTRSILAAPIILKGDCIGVVEAINRVGGDFSFTDLRVFEAFASQAGVAIENARLFASLKERNETLDTLLNEIRDAALLTDGRGGVLAANAAARRFLGESLRLEAALEGMAVTPPLAELTSSGSALTPFEAVRDHPMPLVLAGTASVIRDAQTGAVKGRVVVFRDVTEERREESLKRNFLSLISHKLKTPLSSINGYSQLLYEDAKKQPQSAFLASSLRTILTQGQKLALLVEKLLNFTVLEQLGEPGVQAQPFDLAASVQQAVEALEPWILERDARVGGDVDASLKPLGDASLVRDVVKNLVENAIKFSKEKPPSVSVTAAAAAGVVELRVADDGPGIPPEQRERVFDKFYQIDASFTGQVDGWGLGLTFVKRVLERLGGSVRIEPGPERGSVFVVTLPAGPA